MVFSTRVLLNGAATLLCTVSVVVGSIEAINLAHRHSCSIIAVIAERAREHSVVFGQTLFVILPTLPVVSFRGGEKVTASQYTFCQCRVHNDWHRFY